MGLTDIIKSDQEIKRVEEIFTAAFGYEDAISYNYDYDMEQWEVIWDDTDERGNFDISSSELQTLNLQGFVFVGGVTDVDYDTGDGTMKHMDIIYFKEVELNLKA